MFSLFLFLVAVTAAHEISHDALKDPYGRMLGPQEAAELARKRPEQSKKRLRKLVDKMDLNNDTFVDQGELRTHIEQLHNFFVALETEDAWSVYAKHADKGKLSFDNYKHVLLGHASGMNNEKKPRFRDQLKRDSLRWPHADVDGDGALSKEEFKCLHRAEECDHMAAVHVKEHMGTLDKDGDDKATFEEYLFGTYGGTAKGQENEEWVKYERSVFNEYRDTDKDGFLDLKELQRYIHPVDYDHFEVEAMHLINQCDMDKDGKLSSDEIVARLEVFIDSKATNYGIALEPLRKHDEL